LAIPYPRLPINPLVATGFVAALNVLVCGDDIWIHAQGGRTDAGLIAALLFAVAPWAVINSRKLWAQDLLPPFVIAYVCRPHRHLSGKKPWSLIVHCAGAFGLYPVAL